MNKIFALLAALLLPLGAFAQETEAYVKELEISDFSAVVINLSARVEYEISDKPFIIVGGSDEELVNMVRAYVQDGVLHLRMAKGKAYKNALRLKIRMGSTALYAVDLPGAVNFFANSPVKAPQYFEAKISGAGKTTFNGLEAPEVKVAVSGAGGATLDAVSCGTATVTLSGAGGLNMSELNCSGKLIATINGAGKAVFSGKADSAELTVNGAGGIDAKNLECEKIRPSLNGIGKIATR